MVHAVDAESIAPDGRSAPLRTGARLPDGTIVRTGRAGEVTADGAALGPDSEGVVHAGHLTVLGPAHSRPPANPSPSGGSQTPEPPLGRQPAASAPAQIPLTVQPGAHGTVTLTWSAYDGADLYGYVVLRSNPPADPSYPTDVIHFVPAGGTASYVDAPGRAARYRVDAIDSSGDVLASSRVER